ncbi:MAG: hypothetical protein E7600_07655 [Ruminococcaceae bacterium]|nr:hypothetical protein [Oscillospiraceae bacterium]
MLKKILGQAPFDVSLDKKVIITPGKKCSVTLLFSNDTEYDLPLSCSLNFTTSADVDKSSFDVVLPAEGKTQVQIVFSKETDSKLFSGKGIAELEILDRIFDSKTLYEFELLTESAYKCGDVKEGFTPTESMLFTGGGVFFANKGETVFVEIPLMEEAQYRLGILSGSIKGRKDGDILRLSSGLNRLLFEMEDDGSFVILDSSSDEPAYPDTLNTQYFI